MRVVDLLDRLDDVAKLLDDGTSPASAASFLRATADRVRREKAIVDASPSSGLPQLRSIADAEQRDRENALLSPR